MNYIAWVHDVSKIELELTTSYIRYIANNMFDYQGPVLSNFKKTDWGDWKTGSTLRRYCKLVESYLNEKNSTDEQINECIDNIMLMCGFDKTLMPICYSDEQREEYYCDLVKIGLTVEYCVDLLKLSVYNSKNGRNPVAGF